MPNKLTVLMATAIMLSATSATAKHHGAGHIDDSFLEEQRKALQENTKGKGFGPQSPRDIDALAGSNQRVFNESPPYAEMNLCNIHFHKHAEHKGGEFTLYAGNGDGKGFETGYKYSGKLTDAEKKSYKEEVCKDDKSSVKPGDTIELHYVHTSASVQPGPTLGACLSEATMNPQLRVEAQVFVVVNDRKADNFLDYMKVDKVDGYFQAVNIPKDTGFPVQYTGSTTGPSYNEKASPLQVSWSVRPKVKKVDIASVKKWCDSNIFDEKAAHGVRNLVKNPNLLSPIE